MPGKFSSRAITRTASSGDSSARRMALPSARSHTTAPFITMAYRQKGSSCTARGMALKKRPVAGTKEIPRSAARARASAVPVDSPLSPSSRVPSKSLKMISMRTANAS